MADDKELPCGEKRNGRLVQGYPPIVEAQVERVHQEEEGGDRRSPHGTSHQRTQDMSLSTLDPANLSPRIVDGTEDSDKTEAFTFSLPSTLDGPTIASVHNTVPLQVSTAELAARAEETRGQLRTLGQQVSSLGKEVADLGQLMVRMAQLMDTFMSRSHAPSVCPAHCSPHHAFLPHPSPPGPPPGSLWTDTPTSLPCSPQQHPPHLLRPQELHLGFATPISGSTPPPTPQNPAHAHLLPRPPADPSHTHFQPHPLADPSHPHQQPHPPANPALPPLLPRPPVDPALPLQHRMMPSSHSDTPPPPAGGGSLGEHNRSATL